MPRVPPVTSATRAMVILPLMSAREAEREWRMANWLFASRYSPLTIRRSPLRHSPSSPLHAHRDAHAAADAERREALLHVALLHLVQERDQDAGAGGADRMADRDRAAVDVHDLGVPAHVLVDRASLRREGLVRLDEVEVLDLPAGFLERLARGRDRAGSHDGRVDARRRPGGDARERREAPLRRF